MSIAIIKAQIDRFLKSDTPEVLAIKGAWGVGKTFSWNKFLNEAKHSNSIALDKYSYISLFGLNSLNEVKLSLFMEVVQKKYIGNEQDLDAIKSTDKFITSMSRKAIGILKLLPYSKDFWPTIESLSFYSLKNTIICIDDFERKGKSLDAQDIMGLVSFLKEQKKCKVVLILNDESLGDDASIDYKKYREKVIDIELAFRPSATECADIALPNNEPSMKLKGFIESLGINNIRIIKKIEHLSKLITPLLKGFEDEVYHQALQSLTLFTWCFYNNTDSVPAYDFVKSVNYGLLGLGDKGKEETEKEKQWNAILRKYGFQNTDDFDLCIANTVEQGYVNEGLFIEKARQMNQQIIASKSENAFSEAWRVYHDSFGNNQEEVINQIFDSFKRNTVYISPLNLDGTVRLFRELGKDNLADEIIELYLKEELNQKKLSSLSESHFSSDLKDNKIIEKVAILQETHKEKRTLKEVLSKIAGKNSWGNNDEEILSGSTSDDYYKLFKTEKGPHISSFVDTCLQFGRFVNATEQQKKIAENASIALRKIGKESNLNSMRLRKYGIKLEEKDPLPDESTFTSMGEESDA